MKLRKPICPQGHDKRIVGVRGNQRCRACDIWRKRRDRGTLFKERGEPQYVPNLRAIRKSLGVTTQEFADACGIHLHSLVKIEAQKRRASYSVQRRIILAVRHFQRALKASV